MILGGSAAAGIFAAYRLKYRCRVLSALLRSLEYMEAEITSRLTPLPEIISVLSKEAQPPLGDFFKKMLGRYNALQGESPFSAIWAHSLDLSPELELRPEEMRLLKELGGVLGRYEAEQQIKLIGYTRQRLGTMLDGAEKERERQSRMYGILGVAGGIAAVIILI